MTEPTPLPPSGSSPENHATPQLEIFAASSPVSSGCCGGSSHDAHGSLAEVPTHVHELSETGGSTAVKNVEASSCGSQVEQTSCGGEAQIAHAHSNHVTHAQASHVTHESHPVPHAHEVLHATAPVLHAQVSSHEHASHETSPALAAAPVATLAPTAVAEKPELLHGHAGSLTPLTDATAQDIEAALKSAQKARASQAVAQAARPRGSDLIARKLVLRRDRWDSLLKLTNALRAQRGIIATPAEVAAIVLDAGLNVILEESAQAGRTQSAASVSAAAVATVAAAAPVAAIAPTEKVRGRRKAAAQIAPAPVSTPAPVVTPAAAPQVAIRSRTFHGAEIAHIRKTVRGLPSARSIQRTLALWLGVNVTTPSSLGMASSSLGVPIEDLRALCREFKIYDTANFAQNMKKDSAFFAEVRAPQSGDRLGYDLTPQGRVAAAGFRFVAAPAPAKVVAKKSRPAARSAKAKRAPVKKASKVSAKRRGK